MSVPAPENMFNPAKLGTNDEGCSFLTSIFTFLTLLAGCHWGAKLLTSNLVTLK